MGKILLTIVESGEAEGGDFFDEIAAIGYNERQAKKAALQQLKYDCCRNFHRPSTCDCGHVAKYYKAFGIELLEGQSKDDVAASMGIEDFYVMEYKDKQFLVDADSVEPCGSIQSDDVRKWKSWNDLYKNEDSCDKDSGMIHTKHPLAVTQRQATEAAEITKQAGAAACEMARVNSSMRGGRVLTAVEAHELYRVADDIAQLAGRLNRLCMDVIAARTGGEKGATA